MKSIWRGSITFGLIQIPVHVYSAVKEHSFDFTMLHKKCHSPIQYKRWCPVCKKEVAWSDIEKGIKKEDGSFIVFTKEQLEQYKPSKEDYFNIVAFVPREIIDDIYIEHHFYIGPSKQGEKTYFLFQEALKTAGTVAIGQFVMRDKQYLAMISMYKNALLLNTLNYAYEIRSLEEVPYLKKTPEISKAELDLAKKLIKQYTKKTIKLDTFKDTFVEELKKAIKQRKPVRPKKGKATTRKKEESRKDILDALRASLRVPAKERKSAYARAKSTTRKSIKAKAKK